MMNNLKLNIETCLKNKKPFFYIGIVFIVLSIVLSVCLGESRLDKVLDFFIFSILSGLILLFSKSIQDAFHAKYGLLMSSFILIAIIFAALPQFRNLITPVVSSGSDEIIYDLSSEGFQKNGRAIIKSSLNNIYTLVRIKGKNNNRYKIICPYKIVEFETFYTSYDDIHARWTWTKGVDYFVYDDYIETVHRLNEEVNGWKGRHIVVYKYRKTPREALTHPSKWLLSNLK